MNTKFFYVSALVRRWRNRIDCLLNDAGQWISNREDLKRLVVDYYTRLFAEEADARNIHYLRGFFPELGVINGNNYYKNTEVMRFGELFARCVPLYPLDRMDFLLFFSPKDLGDHWPCSCTLCQRSS